MGRGPRKDIRNKPPSKNDILMEPKMPRLARELFRTELELPNTTNKKKPRKKEKKKDHVRFGEVVKEPPSLTAKPRKASNLTNKGTKQLLLHSQIAQEDKTGSHADVKTVKTKGLTVPKTKKRKHMSSLEREKADKAREHAIMAYRTMRKKQLQQNNKSM
ncbi:hypothetical protein P5673_003264 [Acropora cervicornis]|uniref:Coiled-coil domain-containing protein 137 n=1 Tax=Acropora cervicornis TaxID=6130 RepID=A0AAD9R2K5_ACRCE|nr:hypothetical protein P5673_003264 [Acropora cervicornis]